MASTTRTAATFTTNRTRAGRRTRATSALLAVAVISGSWWVGCESLRNFKELYLTVPRPPAPSILEDDVVLVTATLFDLEPRRLATSRRDLRVRVRLDPTCARGDRVRHVVLWRREGDVGSWQRYATLSADGQGEAIPRLEEGVYGFRASLVLRDGAEDLVPRGDERPVVWLTVDRTPPEVDWIMPAEETPIERGTTIVLEWLARDAHFAPHGMDVEWSADRGRSWLPVKAVRAESGLHAIRWRVPLVAASECVLRVTARDVAGLESSASVVLPLFGASSGTRDAELVSAGADASRALTATTASDGRRHGPRPAIVPAGRSGDDSSAPPPAGDGPGTRSATPSRGTGGEATPSLAFLNFDDGSVRPGGGARYIFFAVTSLPPSTPVHAEWSEAPGSPWQRVGAATAGTGRLLWRLPGRTVESGRLRLVAGEPEAPLVTAVTSETVRIDADPPVAEIVAIHRDGSGAHVVQLNCYDRGPAGLAATRLFVTRDDGKSWSEIQVDDPTAPVRVPAGEGRVGLWVAARDRAGWETPPPEPGSTPQRVFLSGSEAALEMSSPENGVVPGGAEYSVRWRLEGTTPSRAARALIELSADGGVEWELLAEAPLSASRALVILPARNGRFVMRVRARLDDGTHVESRTRAFTIDASPPQIAVGPVPERASDALGFALRASDPGGAGIERFVVHVRPDGETSWRPLAPAAIEVVGDRARLAVGDLAEGAWQLRIHAVDRVGNGAVAPAIDAAPHGLFVVDRTPPALRASPAAFSWVEGQIAAVELEIDRDDAASPLVLERLDAGGAWREMHRWATLPLARDLVRFRVPVGEDELTVRFRVDDRAGNRSHAALPSRAIERAIVLRAPVVRELVAGTICPIEWDVHPLLAEIASELRVEVDSLCAEGGEWRQIENGLPVGGSCAWVVPDPRRPADADTVPTENGSCRLRLRVRRRGEVIGETLVTGPFRILPARPSGGAPAPASVPERVETPVVEVANDPEPGGSSGEQSARLADRAWTQLRLFGEKQRRFSQWAASATRDLRRDPRTGEVLAGEWEKVPQETRDRLARLERELGEALDGIEANFQRALRLDARNADASYGLAVLLLNHRPGRTGDAIRWLRQTVESDSGHVDALNDLGAALIQQREYAEAERALRSAIAIEDRPEARYNLALALFYQRRPTDALPHFSAAIDRGPSSIPRGDGYYYVIMCLLQQGRTEEARERYATYRPAIDGALQASIERVLQ